MMQNRHKRTVRKGRVYTFVVGGIEYGAFVWKSGSQFCGRIIGQPQVPECTARTAIAVRDALSASIGAAGIP
jgi:hypothetical protein